MAQKGDDSIVKCEHRVLKDQNTVTVCIHKSGHVVIYWNCQAVDDTWDQYMLDGHQITMHREHYYVDINFDHILIERNSFNLREGKNESVLISLDNMQRISTNDTMPISALRKAGNDTPMQEWYALTFRNHKLRDHYNPFQNFVLYKGFFILCHGSLVSVQDNRQADKPWIMHHKLESTNKKFSTEEYLSEARHALDKGEGADGLKMKSVYSIFRYEKKLNKQRKGQPNMDSFESLKLGIIFRDGTIATVDKIMKDENGAFYIDPVILDKGVSGQKIISVVTDEEHSRSAFILSKDPNGKLHFDIFINGMIVEMTDGLGSGLDEDMQIIPFFSPSSYTQFAIYEEKDESLDQDNLAENEGL